MTEREATIEEIAQVLEDVAAAGGTHVDDDPGTSEDERELSPRACRLAARLVRRLAERPGDTSWTRAIAILRDAGEDPDAVIADASRALTHHRGREATAEDWRAVEESEREETIR